MSKKKKGRNKIRDQGFKISPGPGIFYYQKKCHVCGRLVWGSSPKSRREAERDLRLKMQTHKQDCEGKQSKLSLPGREGEQSQSIDRVSLRDEKK
ncbi:unnamed protein product [marine sediment metagenome]|uniref:Uncharacterized protein n=1 Tax=marine sediment metagenome TaxID=412755 RepID=X1JFG2_9ZZZZ